jgi:hypothetical protein
MDTVGTFSCALVRCLNRDPSRTAPRSLAAAASPVLAGALLARSPFGWPLLVAGGVKILYDMLLLATFRKIRAPEERVPHERR